MTTNICIPFVFRIVAITNIRYLAKYSLFGTALI